MNEAGTRAESGAQSSTSTGEWINLRDERGHVQASYNPLLRLLIIKERGRATVHDLRKFATPAANTCGAYCENNVGVLG